MKTITVNNKLQNNYKYQLMEKIGENFDPRFSPDLSPKEMLELGVFGGLYLNSSMNEYPKDWFTNAKLTEKKDKNGKMIKDKNMNYFKVNASLPLTYWKEKGWISVYDPRGWFEWYCRYYYGRRIAEEDDRQIKRWVNMKRHLSAVKNNCQIGDISCRPRQRQALLHWGYDSRRI